jgi:3-mercaptopyruvate sulfurtransferase SseA
VSLADDPTADVTPAATAELLGTGTVTVIDVRDGDEWTAGHIGGAIHIPLSSLIPPLSTRANRSSRSAGPAAVRARPQKCSARAA